ncbi:hypothetical protein D3C86_1787530 [compost metagenome]
MSQKIPQIHISNGDFRYIIGGEFSLVIFLNRHHSCHCNFRMLHQLDFNFSKLDPKTTNFHLIVNSTKNFNIPIW